MVKMREKIRNEGGVWGRVEGLHFRGCDHKCLTEEVALGKGLRE